ncbi:MAG TPA: hypothetical protein PK765_04630 [bacterium]|nr:hypothetical protein [bacterium]
MEHAIDHDSKFPVAVKAVVFFEDTFLVLRRSAEDVQAAGEWDIPG